MFKNTRDTFVYARPSHALKGEKRAPSDKSVSHRALIMGGLAEGTTHITGLLESDDVLRTARAVRQFGARLMRSSPGLWILEGTGEKGWRSPEKPLDFGNAGTGCRLVMGAAAGFPLKAHFLGDASLSARPMRRVLKPLSMMGALASSSLKGRLPVSLSGSAVLKGVCYEPAHVSAQVKSALLLAGLRAEGVTEIRECSPTRDHTEHMLRDFGARVEITPWGHTGRSVKLFGPFVLKGTNITVPGDPSSAIFALAAAVLVPGSHICIKSVMDNPTRTEAFSVMKSMGARLIYHASPQTRRGEAVMDIEASASVLQAVTIKEETVPSLLDEIPVLACLAAFAEGQSRFCGLGALRVKESDRLCTTQAMLKVSGVEVHIEGDDLIIEGRGPQGVAGGAQVATQGDHRIAMSALVLGLAAQHPVCIDTPLMIETSFPDFIPFMCDLGADIA